MSRNNKRRGEQYEDDETVSPASYAFWEDFYDSGEGKGESYEWYVSYSHIRSHLLDKVTADTSAIKNSSNKNSTKNPTYNLLHIGCGNSFLAEELVLEIDQKQPVSILNIDVCQNAIDRMNKRTSECTNMRIKNSLTYKVLDATDTLLPSNSFQGIIDKGTIDALLSTLDVEVGENEMVKKVLREMHRLLVPGGYMVCVSRNTCAEPYFYMDEDIEWSLTTTQLDVKSTKGKGISQVNYIYTATKPLTTTESPHFNYIWRVTVACGSYTQDLSASVGNSSLYQSNDTYASLPEDKLWARCKPPAPFVPFINERKDEHPQRLQPYDGWQGIRINADFSTFDSPLISQCEKVGMIIPIGENMENGNCSKQSVTTNCAYTCTKADIASSELKNLLQHLVVPTAIKIISSLVRVPTTTGNLTLEEQVWTASKRQCGQDLNIPDHYIRGLGPGIPDTDLLLYVTLRPLKYPSVASGLPCNFKAERYQDRVVFGRPLAGNINFSPKSFNFGNNTNIFIRSAIQSAVHELIHVLGFTPGLYDSYLDVNGVPHQSPITNSVLKGINPSGVQVSKNITLMSTPQVTKAARLHYQCDNVKGMELEDFGCTDSKPTLDKQNTKTSQWRCTPDRRGKGYCNANRYIPKESSQFPKLAPVNQHFENDTIGGMNTADYCPFYQSNVRGLTNEVCSDNDDSSRCFYFYDKNDYERPDCLKHRCTDDGILQVWMAPTGCFVDCPKDGGNITFPRGGGFRCPPADFFCSRPMLSVVVPIGQLTIPTTSPWWKSVKFLAPLIVACSLLVIGVTVGIKMYLKIFVATPKGPVTTDVEMAGIGSSNTSSTAVVVNGDPTTAT
eukprot:gene13690-16128_t